MTGPQLEPSAQAPWTSTTFLATTGLATTGAAVWAWAALTEPVRTHAAIAAKFRTFIDRTP